MLVRRDRFRARTVPTSRRYFLPQGHVKGAFRGRQVGVPKAPALQPAVAAARRPQPKPLPPAAGFPASARSQSRNARASGFSPEPGATARK